MLGKKDLPGSVLLQGKMKDWKLAIENSDSVKKIRAITPKTPIEVVNIGGTKTSIVVSQKMLDYLLNPSELWARSYSQFVATQSGNSVIFAQFVAERTPSFITGFWDEEDFEPIKDLIMEILKGL